MKKFLLLFVVLFAFVSSAQIQGADPMDVASVQTAQPLKAQTTQNSDTQTLNTYHDTETLSTPQEKTESAKKESAEFSPKSSATNFGATTNEKNQEAMVEEIEGTIQETPEEITQETEEAAAGLEVVQGEETLESTEDYHETLAAAINTAKHLEVDQPEVLSEDSLETPTQEDEKMLNKQEEEATVEEDSEAIVEDKEIN